MLTRRHLNEKMRCLYQSKATSNPACIHCQVSKHTTMIAYSDINKEFCICFLFQDLGLTMS